MADTQHCPNCGTHLPDAYVQDYAIGDRLIVERLRLGLTRAALAQKLGITQTLLSKYQSGVLPIPSTVLLQLHHLGVDVLYVMIGIKQQPESTTGSEQAVSINDNNTVGDIDNSSVIHNHYYP